MAYLYLIYKWSSFMAVNKIALKFLYEFYGPRTLRTNGCYCTNLPLS